MQLASNQQVGTLGLIFITLAGVVSPMGMVIMAEYGAASIFYYALVILFFFIPSAWICSELASGWPQEGGMYHWISVAFGRMTGNIALWSQWLSALVSFPVILTFASSFIAYGINPDLVHHGWFVFTICVGLSVLAVIFPLLGVRPAIWVSGLATFGSTLVPVLLLIFSAGYWLLTGHPSATHFAWHDIIPAFSGFGMFSLLGATVFMFGGMELAAYALQYCKDPKRQYARALFISGALIILMCVLGTLAIAVFLTHEQEDLVAGMMQCFALFLNYYHLNWVIFVLIGLGVVGWMGVLANYMFTMSYGLLASAKDHMLPKVFQKHNRFNAPHYLIILQGVVTIILATLYVLIPDVNSAYWLIEAVVAVVGGLRYLFLFAAAIRLRYSHPHVKRSISIPGGKTWGMNLVAGIAFIATAFSVIMTFVPPDEFNIGNAYVYISSLIIGTLVCVWLPILVGYYSEWSYRRDLRTRLPF